MPRYIRAWLRWHHNDMEGRDWIDFALVVAFIVGATWGVGWVTA